MVAERGLGLVIGYRRPNFRAYLDGMERDALDKGLPGAGRARPPVLLQP